MWVVMDTGAVRNIIEGDSRRVDLAALRDDPEIHVAIAGSAFAELVNQLVSGQMSFEAWANNISQFDGVLDNDLPFFPAGRQLAAFSGVQQNDTNLDEEHRLAQEFWQLLRSAQSPEDLLTNDSEVEIEGQSVPVRVDSSRLAATVQRERSNWIDYVESFASELDENASRADVLQAVISRHGSEPSDSPDHLDRLSPVFEMIATLVHSSLRRRGGYNPTSERRQGDTFDINLLYVLGHQEAVIVTTDRPFVSRLSQTGVSRSNRVMNIEQCNDHLRNGTLTSIISQ